MKARTVGLIVAAAVMGLVAGGTIGAQSGTGNKGAAPIAQQLDRLGLHYTVTKAGNYSITYELDSGRSQVAYIMGTNATVGDTEVRELWSRAGSMDKLPDPDVMKSLLEESGTKEIGFWSIEETDSGSYTIYFSVKVPVYLKDEDLAALLHFTADTADKKEQELFDVDEE